MCLVSGCTYIYIYIICIYVYASIRTCLFTKLDNLNVKAEKQAPHMAWPRGHSKPILGHDRTSGNPSLSIGNVCWLIRPSPWNNELFQLSGISRLNATQRDNLNVNAEKQAPHMAWPRNRKQSSAVIRSQYYVTTGQAVIQASPLNVTTLGNFKVKDEKQAPHMNGPRSRKKSSAVILSQYWQNTEQAAIRPSRRNSSFKT